MAYTVQKHLKPKALSGISDEQIDQHWHLYEAYVKNTNEILEELGEAEPGSRHWSELKRRLGFEFNGMVLHEYYFGNMTKGGSGDPSKTSGFQKAAEKSFGSYETWKADFVGVCKMRGVGWAICYQDPVNERVSNHWITLHEMGNVSGFIPLLVVDVWEHAFLLDYKPAERGKYIDAVFANVDWQAVEARMAPRAAPRRRAAR